MRQVLSVSTPRRFPSWKQWKQLGGILSPAEKRVSLLAICLIVLSCLSIALTYVLSHRIEIPTLGGEYTEGLIGEPQFINPLYASTSDVDADLSSLVYSGLMKSVPGSSPVSDLAENYTVNEEQTVYTFQIRENAMFHNGDPVRAQDVLFTISAIQNPAYRSPLITQFQNVTVNQDDDRTVSFVLKKPSETFLESLAVGILPASVWAEILPQNAPLAALNLQPIGSGPYEFAEFSKDKRGSIRSFTLKANTKFYDTPTRIERLTFKFYSDADEAFDALEQKYVEGVSVIAFEKEATIKEMKTLNLHRPYLPQEVALYMNQATNEQLKDVNIRTAIAHAIDRSAIVDQIFREAVRAVETPILPGMIGYQEDLRAMSLDLEQAQTFMDKAALPDGLTLTLTTIDRPQYRAVATRIKEQLAKININIDILAIAPERFAGEVIEPRNYELLLGSVLFQTDSDPYLFWHSSQIDKNGLNLASYQNKEVDALLEKARETVSIDERAKLYRSMQEQLLKDVPAVFLYQSTYPYATPKSIQNVVINQINTPQDRFANIRDWYIKTKKALK